MWVISAEDEEQDEVPKEILEDTLEEDTVEEEWTEEGYKAVFGTTSPLQKTSSSDGA